MLRLFDILPDIAQSHVSVLIQGESGTGKELVARALHNLSYRKEQRLVVVNCGALPGTLLESELFGYVRGAFTDAKQDKPGRFQLADQGTLFLDEIGDISPAMQVKLLRVLQEGTFEPLGSTKTTHVDVRVIAATSRHLPALIEQGMFRQDLYYRLYVMTITLSPLRERPEDLPLLLDHYLHRLNQAHGRQIRTISPEAMQRLLAYHYPGNVRELQNILEHAFVLCKGSELTAACLPTGLCQVSESEAEMRNGLLPLKDLEMQTILDALHQYHGNKTLAAQALGIDRTTLWRKIKRFHLFIPNET